MEIQESFDGKQFSDKCQIVPQANVLQIKDTRKLS